MFEGIRSIFYSSSHEDAPEYHLQNAIHSGDLRGIRASLTRANLNSRLPNGELPLHFAVREGQIESVQALLQEGSDPMEKDYQGLTAVDHAFLQKNNEILSLLLEQRVSEQLSSAVRGQNSSYTRRALKDIATTIKKMPSEEEIQQLNQLQIAVLTADLETLENLLKDDDNAIECVTASQKLSLLHLATMGNSTEVIDLLLDYGADIASKDATGKTPAHYAAGNPNGAVLGLLIRKGADLSIEDNQRVSALALLGAAAQQRDPLNLTKAQNLMFAITLVQTVATVAAESEIISEEYQQIASYVAMGTGILANMQENAVHMQNIDQKWKRALSWLRLFQFEAIPVIGTPLRVWKTCSVVKSAFYGIKGAYNNASYRTWRAAQTAVVHTINATTSVNKLWKSLKLDWFEVNLFKDYYKEPNSISNEEQANEVHENYKQLFLQNRPILSKVVNYMGVKKGTGLLFFDPSSLLTYLDYLE